MLCNCTLGARPLLALSFHSHQRLPSANMVTSCILLKTVVYSGVQFHQHHRGRGKEHIYPTSHLHLLVAFPLLSQVSLLIAHINLTEKDCSFHPALTTCLICLGNRTSGTFQIGKTLIYSPTCNTTHFCIHRAQNTFSCVAAEKYFDPYDNLVSQTGQLLLFST